MGTKKERIESLEAGLGGLQSSFSRMETGVTDKLHHIEGVLSKLSEILLAKQTPSDVNIPETTTGSSKGQSRTI